MNHPHILTTTLAGLSVLAAGVIAANRIHYWQAWAANVYDNLQGNLVDRLDIEPDMTDLTS